ncbi:MAG: leucine-rich repeat domain-containing protein [Verrucomicrobiae bacterium]
MSIKNLICIALMVVLMLLLPVSSQAQFNYTSTNGTVTITRYTNYNNLNVIIPNTINGLPVVAVTGDQYGTGAFSNLGVTNVTIPNSVTSIGMQAFDNCQQLSSITIPNSVTNIGYLAFGFCYSLTSILFQGNAPSIGSSVFLYDTNVIVYRLPTTTGWSSTFGGVVTRLWDQGLSLGYTTNNGTVTVNAYFGTSGTVYIPPIISGLMVTALGNNAFTGCTILNNVTIPDSVQSIGNNAFYNCWGLQSIIIPNSVINLGSSAFYSCTSLTNVTMGIGVSSIGAQTFSDCYSLTHIKIGNGVTSIGQQSFQYCYNLSSIEIPSSVLNIDQMAFYFCNNLTSITIPGSVTSVGLSAFYFCPNLKEFFFKGSPPYVYEDFSNTHPMSSAIDATVYYLPGYTGWGPSLGHLPTMLWNPQAMTSDPSFGIRSNKFGFNITGTANIPVVLEACTNLSNPVWNPIVTNKLVGGSFYFNDATWTNYPNRFYRIRSP